MDKTRFKAIRKALGWSLEDCRAYLNLTTTRAIRHYEAGTRDISGPVAKLMEQALTAKENASDDISNLEARLTEAKARKDKYAAMYKAAQEEAPTHE